MFITSVISMILILIGAINWGLVGFFNYNFVSMILGGETVGDYSLLARIAFAIVGLAGLWGLSFLGRLQSLCGCCESGRCEDGKNKQDKK